jgi:hypothetical protein
MQTFFATSPLPISYAFYKSLNPSNLRVSRYELSQTKSVRDHVKGSRLELRSYLGRDSNPNAQQSQGGILVS